MFFAAEQLGPCSINFTINFWCYIYQGVRKGGRGGGSKGAVTPLGCTLLFFLLAPRHLQTKVDHNNVYLEETDLLFAQGQCT